MHRKRSIYQQALSPNRATKVLLLFLHLLRVRQEHGYDAEQREVGTYVEDEVYARLVGKPSEEGGAQAAQSKHQSEEHAGYHARLVWHKVGGIDHDARQVLRTLQSHEAAHPPHGSQTSIHQADQEKAEGEETNRQDQACPDTLPAGGLPNFL